MNQIVSYFYMNIISWESCCFKDPEFWRDRGFHCWQDFAFSAKPGVNQLALSKQTRDFKTVPPSSCANPSLWATKVRWLLQPLILLFYDPVRSREIFRKIFCALTLQYLVILTTRLPNSTETAFNFPLEFMPGYTFVLLPFPSPDLVWTTRIADITDYVELT